MNTLFTAKGKKFEFSAQGSDLVPLVGNETKVKIPSEIKLPLVHIVFDRVQYIFKTGFHGKFGFTMTFHTIYL